jgi:hypothetical protein
MSRPNFTCPTIVYIIHIVHNLMIEPSFSWTPGLFGQIYCLNVLKIIDDSANYTRSSRMYDCLHKFRRETSVLETK